MKVLLLAGEESGVLYAERLRRALPGCEFKTYQDHYKTSDLAVMGFWAVIKRIFFFLGVQRTMKRIIREWKPDVVVTIDYPGLNLKLAAYAKARGIPAVHLVCPQVWAWHQGRIPKVAAAVNRLLCFFPFEPALFKAYEGRNFHAAFIGHPMVDIFEEELEKRKVGVAPNTLALLPGSRGPTSAWSSLRHTTGPRRKTCDDYGAERFLHTGGAKRRGARFAAPGRLCGGGVRHGHT